jgi:hypothetical protein
MSDWEKWSVENCRLRRDWWRNRGKSDKMELRAAKMAGDSSTAKWTERNATEWAKEGSCPGIKNRCCVKRMSVTEEWGGANEEHTAQTIERVGTSDEKEAKTVTARLARATSRRAETMSGGWPLRENVWPIWGFRGQE